MAKTIELHFINSEGKVRSLSVDNPKEPINPVATKLEMDTVIAANILGSFILFFIVLKHLFLE